MYEDTMIHSLKPKTFITTLSLDSVRKQDDDSSCVGPTLDKHPWTSSLNLFSRAKITTERFTFYMFAKQTWAIDH